jgi:hypothetical protein
MVAFTGVLHLSGTDGQLKEIPGKVKSLRAWDFVGVRVPETKAGSKAKKPERHDDRGAARTIPPDLSRTPGPARAARDPTARIATQNARTPAHP